MLLMLKTLPRLKLASRMARLGTETAFEVLARAKALEAQGEDIIHLEIGEPDFDTPAHVVEAAVEALRGGWTHYGPAAGLPQVRESIARWVGETRGVEVDSEQVVVVPGGKPVMFYAFLALCEQGDEVLYPNPGFPIYESMISFSGARPIFYPLRERNDFAPDAEDIAARLTPATKMVVLNSPGNPTGGVLGKEQCEALLDVLRDRPDVWILTDEIYGRLLYDGAEHYSPLSHPDFRDRVILLDGFSKTWAMTGWRLGFGVMPPDLAEAVTRLMVNSNSCTASFTQLAGIAALEGDPGPVAEMCRQFSQRRSRIVDLLNAIPGMHCPLPRGAFYVFPNIRDTGLTSDDFQDRLLRETGVAALAGTAFGSEGEGYVRFSYAADIPVLEEGMRRVDQFVRNLT